MTDRAKDFIDRVNARMEDNPGSYAVVKIDYPMGKEWIQLCIEEMVFQHIDIPAGIAAEVFNYYEGGSKP